MDNIPLIAQKGVSPPDTPGRNKSNPRANAGNCRIGMTIDEAAEYTGIGRNTLRQLVSWGKIPVLRIGRKSIIRTDLLDSLMEINQGRNLLDCNQVRHVD